MKYLLRNLDLGQEFDQIIAIHYLQKIVFIVAIIYSYTASLVEFNFLSLLFLSLILITSVVHIKVLKGFYYTYWTFSFLYFAYALLNLIYYSLFENNIFIELLFLISLLLMTIEFSLISSPLYFPRVRWWEYDFRYRADLKVKITSNDQSFKGVLTDLRRNAGCIVLFEDRPIGSQFEIKLEHEDDTFNARAIVFSKRRGTLGRGITYGVKFDLSDDKFKSDYFSIQSIWKKMSSVRLRKKFEESVDNAN